MTFLNIRLIDVVDIVLVAYLLYQFYMLIKGTVAMHIFAGILVTYVVWVIVKALNMQLLSTILGQVMGVGVIAILIVFQQEIRRFFLVLGNKYFSKSNFSIESMLSTFIKEDEDKVNVNEIIDAVKVFSTSKIGALIVIARNNTLTTYIQTGEIINADTSSRLLQNLFFKNSPLHDGAVIIIKSKIVAAGCVLPVSENYSLPHELGLRHRSAVGITENTDAFTVVVSEETGKISYAEFGKIFVNVSPEFLKDKLSAIFLTTQKKKFTYFQNALKTLMKQQRW